MCGIVGIAGPGLRTGAAACADLAATTTAATQALRYRGPDAQATWQGDGVALGHVRLAIVDLTSAGAQPMVSRSGRTVCVYNGEVYNRAELAAPLGDFPFRGHSDTEVLLERFERDGVRVFQQARGMFAIALWDTVSGELTLLRDPIGIKPLYVAQTDDGVAFCSEAAPLFGWPGVDNRVDPESLQHVLTLGWMPAPWTLARGVRQLLPGEIWRVNLAGQVRKERLAPPIGQAIGGGPSDPAEQDRQLAHLVQSAVTEQLEADVPVGVLLSGGVDSSVVAAAAAKARGKIRTFAVVHRDPRYDERKAARAVADHLGSDHTELELPTGGLTVEELQGLVDHHGDPFADSSSLPTRRLAHLVRQHVTVALSGDGGDELFAGYARFALNNQVEQLARLLTPLPNSARLGLRQLGRPLPSALPLPERVAGLSRRLQRALLLALRPATDRSVGTLTFFWPDEQAQLLAPAWRSPDALAALLTARCPLPPSGEPEAAHRLEQHLILPDEMLVKVDRMTMAESIEVRPPLLDPRIAAFAASLPLQAKYGNGEGKSVLKRLARQWVPPWVVDRPKMGFAIPLLDFGGAVLQDATRWALQGADSPLQQLLTPVARQKLQAEFAVRGEGRGAEDSPYRRVHRQWLVTLLALSIQRHGLRVE